MRFVTSFVVSLAVAAAAAAQATSYSSARAAALAAFAEKMGVEARAVQIEVLNESIESFTKDSLDKGRLAPEPDASAVAAALPGSRAVSLRSAVECPSFCRPLKGHAIIAVGRLETDVSGAMRVQVTFARRFEHEQGTVSTSLNGLVRVAKRGDRWIAEAVEKFVTGSSVPRP